MPSAGTSSNGTIRRALSWRWSPLAAIALALALTAPSLTIGLVADDWIQVLVGRGQQSRLPGLPKSSLDLFSFAGHSVGGNVTARDSGLYPWWTDLDVKLAFFRPLASLTHSIDWRLWPQSPFLMHLHNLVWFALALAAVALFYRRFCLDPAVAGLATLLYALDDAHGQAVGWIANRNALVALACALPVLVVHDRWRRDGWRTGAWLAPAIFAVALCAGEASLAVVGYLAAHALWLDRGRLVERLVRLWPYFVVIVIWRIVYNHLGYGTANSGVYIDIGHDPRAFLTALPSRFVFLLAGQLALPWSDLAAMWSYIGPRALKIAFVIAFTSSAFVVAQLIPIARRDPTMRFLATGALLALVPVCSTFPADRLLWFVGIGAMGLVAQFLLTPPRGWWAWSGFVVLLLLHVVLAPPELALRSRSMEAVNIPLVRADESLPMTPDTAGRTVVLVNPPADFFAGYLGFRRAAFGEPRPTFRWLASTQESVAVTREDEHTLRVTPHGGFMAQISEYMLRSRPLPDHAHIDLPGMHVDVLGSTADGRPASARFRFDLPLDDPSLYFARWDVQRYAPFKLPAIGETVTLPPADFLTAMHK